VINASCIRPEYSEKMNRLSIHPAEHHRGQSEFCAWLAGDQESLRKGERTRKDLMVTCAELLASEPFDRLTVSGLCKAAGVAHGTFYVYFENLNTILAAGAWPLCRLRSNTNALGGAARQATPSGILRRPITRCSKQNAGLMKCLVMGVDAFPEARAAFQRLNNEWAKTVVRLFEQTEPEPDLLRKCEMLRRAYALGGMVDQYLTALFRHRRPVDCLRSRQDTEAVIDHTYRHLDQKHAGMSLLKEGHLLPLDEIAQHRQQAWERQSAYVAEKLGLLPKALGWAGAASTAGGSCRAAVLRQSGAAAVAARVAPIR
jgi:AcrR family transcriptional regulator